MKRLYALAPMLLSAFAMGQPPNPHYELPPAAPPPSCAFAIASVDSLTGPVVAKRLAIQLKALQSAQNGVSALAAGMKGLDSEASPALAMSSLFTGTKQAHDALLCSAFLIAKYKSIDKNDENARTLLIVAYNQEAAAIADLEAHSKEQFLRADKERTQAVLVKDAERMTAMTSLQQEAATTLAEMTSFSLLMSVDMTDPDAKDTKLTLIPCDQYEDLKAKSIALSHETKSAYTDTAGFFVTFLDGHTCK
jgi:hypothetical protein